MGNVVVYEDTASGVEQDRAAVATSDGAARVRLSLETVVYRINTHAYKLYN